MPEVGGCGLCVIAFYYIQRRLRTVGCVWAPGESFKGEGDLAGNCGCEMIYREQPKFV